MPSTKQTTLFTAVDLDKVFPILYSRGENGKVLEWEIFVKDNSFYTRTGAQGFKHVTGKPTFCTAKNVGRVNETTPEEQAIIEAEAKWVKKKKSKGYFENVTDIDKFVYVEPMLAKILVDRKSKIDPTKGLIAQCKFNGMRCVATKEGLFTRTGERYTAVPHIEESLRPFFRENPDAILDGELFNMEFREQLNKIAELIRRTKNLTTEHFESTKALVKYYVYDGYGVPIGNQELSYRARKVIIDRIANRYDYLESVEDHWVYSWDELDKVYNDLVADKQEGAIVRIPDSPYENKRSQYLLKMKPTDDDEMTITAISEGQGNWAGVAKVIGLRMKNGVEFDGTFKGTMEEADECLKNKDYWIGKTVTIHYNGFTGLGTPNGAQFFYRNCLKGDR